MTEYPPLFEALIAHLSKLPGIGRRGAERMALAIFREDPQMAKGLGSVLANLHKEIRSCNSCGFMTQQQLCSICLSNTRDSALLCIVESHADVMAFEKSGGFSGRYHILGGKLSPLKGISPDQLNLRTLPNRIREQGIQEIILGTSPDVEGDATALYLMELLSEFNCRITQIGRGLPNGSSLGVADSGTLRLALETRRPFHT
ncbi:MAG: recombination mediator RecR [Sumerlaeia bacterium]